MEQERVAIEALSEIIGKSTSIKGITEENLIVLFHIFGGGNPN